MIEKSGMYFVPGILTLVAILLLISRKDLFASFVNGAREGLTTCINLLPILIILVTAVKMFTASGAMEILCTGIGVFADKTNIPKELFPLIIVRPLSGSAANATVNELFNTYGADSFIGRSASVIMGASDTIIYTLVTYFTACGITRTRHAYPAAILTMLFCVCFSVFLTYIFF